jgi:hypothetical protein
MVVPRVPPTTIIRDWGLMKMERLPPMRMATSTSPNAETIPISVAKSIDPILSPVINNSYTAMKATPDELVCSITQ